MACLWFPGGLRLGPWKRAPGKRRFIAPGGGAFAVPARFSRLSSLSSGCRRSGRCQNRRANVREGDDRGFAIVSTLARPRRVPRRGPGRASRRTSACAKGVARTARRGSRFDRLRSSRSTADGPATLALGPHPRCYQPRPQTRRSEDERPPASHSGIRTTLLRPTTLSVPDPKSLPSRDSVTTLVEPLSPRRDAP